MWTGTQLGCPSQLDATARVSIGLQGSLRQKGEDFGLKVPSPSPLSKSLNTARYLFNTSFIQKGNCKYSHWKKEIGHVTRDERDMSRLTRHTSTVKNNNRRRNAFKEMSVSCLVTAFNLPAWIHLEKKVIMLQKHCIFKKMVPLWKRYLKW